MGLRHRGLTLAAAALCLPALAAPSAHAAFPGANGKIAFESSPAIYTVNPDGSGLTQVANIPGQTSSDPRWSPDGSKIAFYSCCHSTISEIYTVNADGSNLTQITNSPNGPDSYQPSWSPDGTKLAFTSFASSSPDIFVMNADGSNRVQLTTSTANDNFPTWSPDGTRIAFVSERDGNPEIYVMDADGSNQARLTNDARNDFFPDWSPDGGKIAWATNRDPHYEIYVMDADGTNQTRLTNDTDVDWMPAWSPDGTKIAFRRGTNCGPNANPPTCTAYDIDVMNPDGSSQVAVPNTTGDPANPDWQPIPLTYVRPKGATPTRVSLVPAFAQCASPNRTHGAPLAFPSCNPPSQTSGYLTVGTPDANGAGANASGYVRFAVGPGDPSTPADEADVGLKVSLTDVRRKSDLSDYPGQLELLMNLRITDRDNTPNPGGPGPGTVEDTPLTAAVSCTSTASTTIGSSCGLQTTIDALYPGAVKETRRSVWQLGQVQLLDGGSDDLAATTAGNTLFMSQGIFVP